MVVKLWSKGNQAPKTRAAIARARELASHVEDASERFAALCLSKIRSGRIGDAIHPKLADIDLAMVNLGIDSKPCGCDVVALKVEDIAPAATRSIAQLSGRERRDGV
jgi:hypothetical protein